MRLKCINTKSILDKNGLERFATNLSLHRIYTTKDSIKPKDIEAQYLIKELNEIYLVERFEVILPFNST